MKIMINFIKTVLFVTALSFVPFVTHSIGFPLPLAQSCNTAELPIEYTPHLYFGILGNLLIIILLIGVIPEHIRNILLRKRTVIHIFFAGAANYLLSLPVFIISMLITLLFETLLPGSGVVFIDTVPRLFFVLFYLLVNVFEQKVILAD